MTRKHSTKSGLAVVSKFAPAPVLKSENSKAYDALVSQVMAWLKPTDIIEEMLVLEIADLMWRSRRYGRYSTGLIKTATPAALEQLLTPLMDDPSRFGRIVKHDINGHRKATPVMELVNQWLKQDPKAIKKVNELLASAGLTMEDVEARAFINEIKNMKDAEQLSANLHARLHAELRELDYRRKARPRHDPVDVDFGPSIRHMPTTTATLPRRPNKISRLTREL